MKKYIFLCLFVVAIVQGQEEFLEEKGLQCNPEQNGIVSAKVTLLVEKLNRLRNLVASGNELNHKGKKEAAANMNYLAWSDGIARAAQNCAAKCPTFDGLCKPLINNMGYVNFFRPMLHGSDWDPTRALQSWLQDQKFSRQILWGRAKQFGCGRSVNRERASTNAPIEHIVCLFDEAARDGMEPYVTGTTAAACQTGTASGYFALCATAYGKMLTQLHFTDDVLQHQFALGGETQTDY